MQTSLDAIPYAEQFLGVWAMEQEAFASYYKTLQSLNIKLHLNSDRVKELQSRTAVDAIKVQDGIALVALHGTLMKQESSVGAATSTIVARRQIRMAAADPTVNAIMVHVESPGGTAAGTSELATEIAAAAKQKPVWAYIEDLGASAAYWAASQSARVSANATGLVGSIGTFTVVADTSGQAEMDGIKVHVVSTGKYKGAGVPGAKVTDEQLAHIQDRVEQLNTFFLDAVQTGRKLTDEQLAAVSDGRVHIGRDAVAMGLVDAVETFDEAFTKLRQSTFKRSANTMTVDNIITPAAEQPAVEQTEIVVAELADTEAHAPAPSAADTSSRTPAPATLKQIQEHCIGCSYEFIVRQLGNEATLETATREWMEIQQQRIADAEAKASRPGVAPLTETVSTDTTATDFWSLVSEKIDEGIPRPKAIKYVVKNHPDAHQAMLDAANS